MILLKHHSQISFLTDVFIQYNWTVHIMSFVLPPWTCSQFYVGMNVVLQCLFLVPRAVDPNIRLSSVVYIFFSQSSKLYQSHQIVQTVYRNKRFNDEDKSYSTTKYRQTVPIFNQQELGETLAMSNIRSLDTKIRVPIPLSSYFLILFWMNHKSNCVFVMISQHA